MNSNDEHILDWHRQNGAYQVWYPDGQYPQPFTLKVARDYQELFGGDVVLRGEPPDE